MNILWTANNGYFGTNITFVARVTVKTVRNNNAFERDSNAVCVLN